MANYRNKKLLNLAKEAPCVLCGSNDGTVVAAHSNQLIDGKGTAIKAHDYRIAYLCNYHHFYIDNDKSLNKEDRRLLWEHAHRKTIGWLFDSNKISVKG
jgi:hypothetical protein